MVQTVTECLNKAMDSVNLINGVNGGSWEVGAMTQSEINEMVQRNVDHLETILEYAPVDSDDDTPNVKGSSSSKKTDCTNAITTAKSYISSNN